MWPNIIRIVAFWKSLPKSKHPSSKTFEAVCRGVDYPVKTAKLGFFSFFASIFQPFLVKYQSKVPMLPFLYTDLSQLLRSVLTLVVKEDVLQACSSGLQLSKSDLDKQIMFKKKRCFHLGFATESNLAELRKKDVVNESTNGEFLLGMQKCVVATLKKLCERCPTGSVILRSAVIFDPAILKSSTSTVLSKTLWYMLQNLVSFKIVATKEADLAYQQFGLMHDEVMGAVDINGISRLDDYYFQKLKISKYAELSAIVKISLTLSHGQSDVELGFSCNTLLLEENIKDDSIVSKRLIKDHLVSNNLKPHMLEITSQIRASCRQAHQRYHSYLEDQKKMQDKLSLKEAKEIICLEIQELQEKVLILEKSIANLNQTFVSLVQEAEKSRDMPVKLAEANALKRKSEEQSNEKRKIEDTIKVLQAKRRKP